MHRRTPRATGPSVDPLEARTLLSASIGLDGTLQVTATDGPDAVVVRHGVNPNLINIQVGPTSAFVFALDRVKLVAIDLGAGDDTVQVDASAGLLTGVAGDLPIRIDGGAGSDSITLTGAPSGVSAGVDETYAPGPEAQSATITARVGSGGAQVVSFLNMESASDVSTANSLTVVASERENVVELSAGPLLAGVTPTGQVQVYDIGAAPPPTTTPPPTTNPPPTTGGGNGNGGTETPSSHDEEKAAREAEKAAKKAAEDAAKAAKKAAEAAKKAAREAAKKAKEQAKEEKKGAKGNKGNKENKGGDKKGNKHARHAATASPAAASATAAGSLVVGRAYLPLVFANKAAITIDAAAGDDHLAVNLPAPAPAGLQSLTLDAGPGTDALAEQATPAGVTVTKSNIETTTATPDYVLA